MATIISIETSTEVCSTALEIDGENVWERHQTEGQQHSTLLAPYLKEMKDFMTAQNIKADAVAVSSGPGSYTGLRIGVSTAKGLCFGADVKLLAIPTLRVIAQSVLSSNTLPTDALLCPMIDARRMEVYTAFFDTQLNQVRETSADIITEESFHELLDQHPCYFFGNGAQKCKSTITHANAHFIDGVIPLATNMAKEAEEAYKRQEYQDVAYFEPAYLKEFIATQSKNKVLGFDNQK